MDGVWIYETTIVLITLSGQTPSQKNAKQIAINRRTGMRFPMTAPAVKAWQEGAMYQALAARKDTYYCPITKCKASYTFYVKDNRRRDIDNMIASCNDVLVRAGVITDDSWQVLSIGRATAEIDKDYPRAVILLT